ncbi:MAG: hypothetical protein WAU17_02510 [Nitrospirales bacterium]
MREIERAVEILKFKGHDVWRMDFPAPPFPGLYRISGGPELTEAQLIDASEKFGATVLASDGILFVDNGNGN